MAQPSAAQKLILGPQCWGCRERRVRCGSETPGCAKCAAKGVACPGYGPTRPLRWKKPQNLKEFPGKKRAAQYNERVAPDLVVTDSPTNPLRWSLESAAIAPAYLNHVYVAISAFHRMVQRRFGGLYPQNSGLTEEVVAPRPRGSDSEEAKFCRYYASALSSLNEALSKNTKKPNLTILAGVMMLLFTQLQRAAYGQWRIHLEGFKKLVDHFGGWKTVLRYHVDSAFMLSNLLIVDAMSTTTSPVQKLNVDTIRWHTAYLELLPQLDYDVIPTATPIPPHLVRTIIMTNLARATRHCTTGPLHQHAPFTLSHILTELDFTLTYTSSTDVAQEQLCDNASPKPDPDSKLQTPNQALFANCYRSAIVIYAMEAFACMDAMREPLVDVILTTEARYSIEAAAYESLMHSLRSLFAMKNQPLNNEAYWKFVFWPLAIAGVQSVVFRHDSNDFEYICAGLYEMTAELGTLCMRDAAVFLRQLWAETRASALEATERRMFTWDEIFKEAPLFLL
ncbi:fungal-specific transcription factor domain-containing protein [Aspergillus karnatakaensis]|uniref:Zn(II)2Cys6 transcription factor n=1 Tax=Aspergillus karnatakaensis TaxID=1810916 RepID=UPI003CCD54D5